MSRWVIGIDPGLSGATVALQLPLSSMRWMCIQHRTIDRVDGYLSAVAYDNMLRPWSGFNTEAVMMEFPMILSGQGGAAKIGINWGILRSAWERRSENLAQVHPVTWKMAMITPREAKEYKKQASCRACEAIGYIIPTKAVGKRSKIKDDGVADAILIARYAVQTKGLE